MCCLLRLDDSLHMFRHTPNQIAADLYWRLLLPDLIHSFSQVKHVFRNGPTLAEFFKYCHKYSIGSRSGGLEGYVSSLPVASVNHMETRQNLAALAVCLVSLYCWEIIALNQCCTNLRYSIARLEE